MKLSKMDRRSLKTLTRRAEFLESRIANRTREVTGTDLDKQEARCLRHVLDRAYGQHPEQNS